MTDGPYIAEVASLIGDPARANILCALMDGRAHTAAELAHVAGVGAPTASAHLARLVAGGLLAVEKQGRHRYYRLASPEVAAAIEALTALAPAAAPRLRRPGPRDAAMRQCRTCYDHLAGAAAVAIAEACLARGWLVEDGDGFALSKAGSAGFAMLGEDVPAAHATRRRFAARCLDWSERRAHLGGALGAALLSALEMRGWVARVPGSRVARITAAGAAGLRDALGVETEVAEAA
ncbi:MAG TPA: winged helix-turn-helix domain-containing protein [Paracoccaceae bacterium]|nr:winged helix-turn-helix domain-containing protein [Paracoccaceae bacterium]